MKSGKKKLEKIIKTIKFATRYDSEKKVHKIGREEFLKGFFDIADVLLKSTEFNKDKLKKGYSDILRKLD